MWHILHRGTKTLDFPHRGSRWGMKMSVFSITCIVIFWIALARSDESTRRLPSEAAVEYFDQGNLLALEHSKFEDSLPFYRAAVRLSPENANYWVALAEAEHKANISATTISRRLMTARLHGYNEEILQRLSSLWGVEFPLLAQVNHDSIPSNVPAFDAGKGNNLWKAPFVFRKFIDQEVLSLIPSSSLTILKEQFGSQKVEFYPQNMLQKPSRVFKVSMSSALDFLDYPEGAYVSCDISEPGTYIQWNVANDDFQQLLSGINLSENDNKNSFWQTLVAKGKLDESFLVRFVPGETREAKLLQANFQWQQLALDKHWNMVLVGEKGSGMFFHMDSLPVGSWQIQLQGRKKWKLCPPLSSASSDSNPDNEMAKDIADDQQSCLEIILEPGDLLYYPPFYGHSTLCLDTPTISMSSSLFHAENKEDFLKMEKIMRDRCQLDTPTVRYAPGVCAWFIPYNHSHDRRNHHHVHQHAPDEMHFVAEEF